MVFVLLAEKVNAESYNNVDFGNRLIKGKLKTKNDIIGLRNLDITGNSVLTGTTTFRGNVIFESTTNQSLGFLESFSEGVNKGFMTLQKDGTAENGTANIHNVIHLGNGHKINYVPIVGQTLTIAMSVNGLNIGLDQVEDDGAELYTSCNGASGISAIIGTTAAFQTCLTFQIADVSGTDDFHFGFRRAETVNATFDNYLDVASIGFVTLADPAAIQIETILNNGATTTTDTTDTLADATSVKFCVLVSALGVVTYTIDGIAPSTTAAFTFDDGDLVIPFVQYLQSSDFTGDFDLEEWKYSLQ
jgi:hypothetical protein